MYGALVAGRRALLAAEPFRLVGELLVAPPHGETQLNRLHEDDVKPRHGGPVSQSKRAEIVESHHAARTTGWTSGPRGRWLGVRSPVVASAIRLTNDRGGDLAHSLARICVPLTSISKASSSPTPCSSHSRATAWPMVS